MQFYTQHVIEREEDREKERKNVGKDVKAIFFFLLFPKIFYHVEILP